jgi:hypothetical protein
MRKLEWGGDKPFSEEDMRFIVQAGVPGWIERAEAHQARFNKEMPDLTVGGDTLTKYADDPTARVAELVESQGAPVLVDPTAKPPEDSEGDDYDEWKVADLETEVRARNEMPDTSEVVIEGTGRDGKVLKADLVKGLRLWDQDNPQALND